MENDGSHIMKNRFFNMKYEDWWTLFNAITVLECIIMYYKHGVFKIYIYNILDHIYLITLHLHLFLCIAKYLNKSQFVKNQSKHS